MNLTPNLERSKSAPGGDITEQVTILSNVNNILRAIGIIVESNTTDLITLQRASRLRGVSVVSLWEMVKRGSLPAFKVKSDSGRAIAWLVRQADIESMPPVKHPLARCNRNKTKDLPANSPTDSTVKHTESDNR